MPYRKSKICVYCQTNPANSEDHVPPSLIFGKPSPGNRVWVSCCKSCNENFSTDDTYLRQYLTSRQESEDHPRAPQLTEKALKALSSDNRMNAELMANTRHRWKVRIDGTHELVAQMRFDEESLRRSAIRIVRGLMFYHHEHLYPVDYPFEVGFDHGKSDHARPEFVERVNKLLKDEPRYKIGDVFAYRFGYTESMDMTIWQLEFMDKIWFCVWSGNLPQIEDYGDDYVRIPMARSRKP